MRKLVFYSGTMEGGGAEKACYMFANRFAEDKNFKVYLFLNEKRGPYLKNLNANIEVVELFNIKNKYFKYIFLKISRFNFFTFFSLMIKLRKLNSDIIISFAEWPNLYNGLLKYIFRNKIKCILFEQNVKTFINDYRYYGISKFLNWLALISYSNADKIFCCSEDVLREVKKKITDKHSVVIYNPIDCKQNIDLSSKDLNDSFDPQCTNFVAIGRFAKQKDYPTMLKAFEEAYFIKKNITLYILGEGSEKDSLINLASSLSSKERIHFLGFVDNPFIYLRNADALIHSALFEGFGNVFAEAISVGTPILTTDCNTPKEIIKNSLQGTIVPIGDFKSLGESIAKQPKKNEKIINSCKNRALKFDIENSFKEIKIELEFT